jgi:glycosyltransferase involved in cell wall biosynthesis
MKVTKNLRVLIIRNAFQKDAGGAEQYALNLAVALRNLGHKPILVTKVLKIQEKAQQEGIKFINAIWHDSQRWDRLYYLRYLITTAWYIYVIIRYHIDVINPQSRDDFVFATRAGSIMNKKVVWTDHADLKYILDDVNHYNPRMRNWVINASKRAATITCCSFSDQKAIEAVAPDLAAVTVVHNGVFIPTDIEPVRKTNKIVVGTNARLVKTKGIGELLTGFAELNNLDTDLWLLGGVSGNLTKYKQLAKELGIESRVHFWDYIPKPNNVVASMDIFVHASYLEAFSLAIIEAAMLGRPIIATNVGGTPEIIDSSCGVLIEARNALAITNALKKLIDDEALRKRTGEAAKIKAMRDFDIQKIVEHQIIPLYLKP